MKILNISILCVAVILHIFSETLSDYQYESYQKSIQCISKHQPVYPGSVYEIQKIVCQAISTNDTVKPLGTIHSISDSICTTGIPVILVKINHFRYNELKQTATIGAGLKIETFLEYLLDLGQTVHGVPAYTGTTVGGIIATGAHGTGLKYPTTISEQVVSFTFVDGLGMVRKVSRGEKYFKALQVSLGLLGIVYEIEIATQPLHKLKIHRIIENDQVILNAPLLVNMAKMHDHFQFWWYPSNQKVVIEAGEHVAASVVGDCRANYEISKTVASGSSIVAEFMQTVRIPVGLYALETLSMLRRYSHFTITGVSVVQPDFMTSCLDEDFAIGFSHRLVSFSCKICSWDAQYYQLNLDDTAIAIPVQNLDPALKSLNKIFRQWPAYSSSGIWIRFLSAGNAYMGINEGPGDWAIIEWITFQRWNKSTAKHGMQTFQLIAQILIHEFSGRPHWSKNGLHFSSSAIIQKAHPHVNEFVDAMLAYDPNERFMNDFGRRVKYGENTFTSSTESERHCALTERCICKVNIHCGDVGLLGYRCGQMEGYRNYNVCISATWDNLQELCGRSNLLHILQKPHVFVTPGLIIVLLVLYALCLKYG